MFAELIMFCSMAGFSDQELAEAITTGRYDLVDGQVGRRLQANPNDGQAQFAKGFTTALRGLERFGQSLYRYGVGNPPERQLSTFGMLSVMQLPIPPNSKPEPATYEDYRKVLSELQAELDKATAELAAVKPGNFKLKIPVGMIALDLNADGKLAEEEKVWRQLANTSPSAPKSNAEAEKFVLAFDYADSLWLHGYCKLTSAWLDLILSLDTRESYEFAARILSNKHMNNVGTMDANFDSIFDIVAMIHLARFKVAAPERVISARQKFLDCIANSRKMMNAIAAETDDEMEWIPGPNQTSQIPNMKVTPEIVATWTDTLNELEMVLEGKKLVPHFRIRGDKGINLKKFMEQVKVIDVVMLVHGSDFLPYVEAGPVTSTETWRELNRRSNNNLFFFGFWFN